MKTTAPDDASRMPDRTTSPATAAAAVAGGYATAPPATGWRRRVRFMTRRTLRSIILLDDTPARIGRGCAAGLFTGMLPIFGQILIAMIVAKAVRGNLFAAITASWLSNPFTALPIWYGCYRLGHALLPIAKPPLGYDDLAVIVTAFGQLSLTDGLGALFALLGGIMLPLLLGSVLAGLALAGLGWVAIPPVVAWMHRRRDERRQRWLRNHLPPPEQAP
jgi:uncharacterized protein (DUF2062 family)